MPETSVSMVDICKNGHRLTPDNVFSTGIVHNICKKCTQNKAKYSEQLLEVWPTIVSNAWKFLASCRSKPHNFMFNEHKGAAGNKPQRKLCAGCPVRRQCFTAGFFEPFGIWGGYTAEERKEMRTGSLPIPFELVFDERAIRGKSAEDHAGSGD